MNNLKKMLFFAVFGLSLLGQFQRMATPFGLVSYHEVVMVLFLFLSTKELFQKIKSSRTVLFFSLFFIWAGVSTLWNAYLLESMILLTTGGAYLLRTLFYIFFAVAGTSFASQKRAQIWLTVFACIGIGQYLFLPDTRLLFLLGWDDHLNRASATLLDPGFFGLLMASGTLLAAKSKKQTVLFSLFLLALALSFSRASYVAYIAGILTLSFLTKVKRYMLFIPLLALCLLLVPKDGGGEGQNLLRTNSIAARTEVAEFHTQSLSLSEVLIGRGWYYETARKLHQAGIVKKGGQENKIETNQRAGSVDNIYLHVFLSTGALGFGLFLLVLRQVWNHLVNVESKAVFVGVLAHSFFSTTLIYPWVLLLLGTLISQSAQIKSGSGRT